VLYIFKCKKCEADIPAYCGEYINYTEEGWKTRRRQMDAMLCTLCFGETPELKQKQVLVPCVHLQTGNTEV
jgi:hypothetical protein